MGSVSNASFYEYGGIVKPIVNDALDVAEKYVSEKPYSFAKAIYVLSVDIPCALGLMSNDNKTASIVKEQATMIKLSRSPVMFFDAINNTARSAWSYLTGNPIANGKEKIATIQPFSQVVRNGAKIVNPVTEMATFLTKAILFIPKQSIRVLNGINAVTIAFLMMWSAYESLSILAKNRVCDLTKEEQIVARERENIDALLDLVQQVSYTALGVFTALTVFGSVVVNPLIMTALSANTVILGIVQFYYQTLGQEKKINY